MHGMIEDEVHSLQQHRARLKRYDAALRAALKARLTRRLGAPLSFATAAVAGAVLGLVNRRAAHRPQQHPPEDMPSFARWIVLLAELSGPVLSVAALLRQRRSEASHRDGEAPH